MSEMDPAPAHCVTHHITHEHAVIVTDLCSVLDALDGAIDNHSVTGVLYTMTKKVKALPEATLIVIWL